MCFQVEVCTLMINSSSFTSAHFVIDSFQAKQFFNGDRSLPIFEEGRRTRYTAREATGILLGQQHRKCTKTPLRARRNISFIIGCEEESWADVKADMNGTYRRMLRCCTWTVEVDGDNHVRTLKKEKCDLVGKSYHIYTHSSQNDVGLCRSIFIMRGTKGDIVNSQCLLQYTINVEDCKEVEFSVPSHGNSKEKCKPFYPSKRSTLQAMKEELTSNSPAVALRNVSVRAGGVLGANNPGDIPRGKHQLYDLKHRMKKKDDINDLLEYAKHSEERVVLEHHDVPEDLWVLAKPHMTNDLSRFCTSEVLHHPFSVDPTFEFGRYEITPVTYKHLFLKSKRTGSAPSFLGPTAIHYSKTKLVYKKIVHAVASASPDLAEKGKGYITDGEESLYTAIQEELKHATGLRCFRHFHQNCRDKLYKLGIQKPNQQKVFLDTVFGFHEMEGILDAVDENDFQTRMVAAKMKLDPVEVEITCKTPEFCMYLKNHSKMITTCMLATAREKAGMPKNNAGKPVKCYSNQSESINNKLTRTKEAISNIGKNKGTVTKLEFTRDVFEEVDRHQQEELTLAICGLSNDFELAEIVDHVKLSPEQWFDLSPEERKLYVKSFNKMTVQAALKRKSIPIRNIAYVEENEYKQFSLDVKQNLKSMNSWPEALVNEVVDKALELLNCPCKVQREPTTDVNARKTYLVASKDTKKGWYKCAVYKGHVNCTCPCYKYKGMCKHSICVAEIEGILTSHLDHLKKSPRRTAPAKSNLLEPPKEAQGKKGGSHRNPWRPQKDTTAQCPFTEIYHNNNPFTVVFLKEVPNAKQCTCCKMDFPRIVICKPYNIVLAHQERWMYPSANGKRLPSAKFTTKFYCVRRQCILGRFPYFKPSLVKIPPETHCKLEESHFSILSRELDLEL